jgi:NAD(P)-dependent dehydrogenase (short-subunit alcohol dehydrogenase family)
MSGLLEGKVVLITGAGNGIGRECALAAAAQGAKVLVNDLGGSGDGRGDGSASAADTVVAEIRAAGGAAAANHGSVADMAAVRQMVEQCRDELGGLHAVMNPAGILRDGMFHKMRDEDFFAVVDVHLRGAYNVARATIELFRDQEDGAYLFFTSTSGLIGNLGQANYAAAKMGVVGLSRILAMEGARRNVRANAIAPFAWTRMVSTIPVTDEASRQRVETIKTRMRADQVARFCVALCAEEARQVSGQIFTVRGNEIFLMSQPRPVRSVARADGWTAESIVEQCLPALENWFCDLEPSASAFPGDPV